jgi:hypothetical protein
MQMSTVMNDYSDYYSLDSWLGTVATRKPVPASPLGGWLRSYWTPWTDFRWMVMTWQVWAGRLAGLFRGCIGQAAMHGAGQERVRRDLLRDQMQAVLGAFHGTPILESAGPSRGSA